MADEGPTTVATIVAKIKGDLDAWEAAYRTALAQGHELDAMSPTITVDANVAEALAKLEAVEAAEKKLQATEKESAKNLSVASQQRAIYNQYLYDEAKASKAAAAAGKDKAQLQYWQQVLVAVAALVPLMSPLATQAFSVTAGLGAMGAAGVLAVFGIKNAMAAGNATGLQYSAGLRILKGDFDSLSQTSAVAMLKSYNQAIGQIHQAMPALNGDVSVFSSLLGTAGNLLLSALIAGLRIAKPLLVDTGVYIERVAGDLLKWTNNGGFKTFVTYAIQMLPRVASALGELATLFIRVVTAASPIGTVVLGILQGVATALNALPLPVLTALIAAGGSFFLTFKLWSALTPVFTAVAEGLIGVAAAEDLALGPIGLVIAAVTALGGAALITAVAVGTATQSQVDYTAAVEEDNGVIGRNIALQVAKTLQMDGAFKAANRLGISTDLLVKAALAEGKAHNEATEALAKKIGWEQYGTGVADQAWTSTDKNSKKNVEYARNVDKVIDSVSTQQKAIKAAIASYNELQNAIGGSTISTKEQLQAQTDLANEYGTSVSAYEIAKASQKQTQVQLDATTLSMRLQNDASGLLRNALDILNGGSLDVLQAQTGLAAANNQVTDSFKQNGLVVDGSTKAAVANQQALEQQVQSAQQVAEAIGKQTGSSEAAVQSYKDSKQAIEDQLAAQGELTPAVQEYLDKLYDIANLKVPPTKLDVDDAAARKKLADWATFVKQTIPSDARLTVHLDTSNNAAGGTIGRAAGGSVGPSGTVYGPGSTTSDSILTRLSRGEEVTNASAASAPGVRPLLKSLNSDPVGTMAKLAAGGSAAQVHNHFPMTAVVQADPQDAFIDFERRQNLRAA